MIWKVSYDFTRKFWITFGHVGYVEADDAASATLAGETVARLAEPGATIVRLSVRPSSEGERARFLARVEALRVWQANVAAGKPNDPEAL